MTPVFSEKTLTTKRGVTRRYLIKYGYNKQNITLHHLLHIHFDRQSGTFIGDLLAYLV